MTWALCIVALLLRLLRLLRELRVLRLLKVLKELLDRGVTVPVAASKGEPFFSENDRHRVGGGRI
jgi:hypothetical protein